MNKTVAERTPWRRIAIALASLASPMVWLLFLAPPEWIHWPALAANTALFAACLPIFIVLHEASHALSAKILRLQVPRITIGFGRHIARFHIGETVVTVGMIQLGALTYMVARSLRLRRLRGWLATAAGPAINALICIALLPLLERTPSGRPSLQLAQHVAALQVIFFANAYLVVLNLLPFKRKGCPTDGLALLTLPFRKSSFFKDEAPQLYAFRGYEALEEKRNEDAIRIYEAGLQEFPNHWLLLHDRAVALSLMGSQQRARREYEALLEHPDVKEPIRALIGSNIAWCILLSSDISEELDRADELSGAAAKIFPGVAAVNGVRGAVLAARGQHAEAIEVLQKAMDLNERAFNRAHNAAWLALAYSNAREPIEAERCLALSRRLDAACLSLPVVEALMPTAALSAQEPLLVPAPVDGKATETDQN